MTQPRELIALITRLRKSGQPLKQVRLLLKLWQAVEDVPRRERFRLLRHLGMEGGEQLVSEFLAGGGRLDPKTAATAVQLLDSVPKSRLRAFTSRYLSPEETGEIVEMLRRLLAGQAGKELEKADPPAPPPSEEPDIRGSSTRAKTRREQLREQPHPEPVDTPEDSGNEVQEIASDVVRTAAKGLAAVAAAKAAAQKGGAQAAGPEETEPSEPAPPEGEPEPSLAQTPAPGPEPSAERAREDSPASEAPPPPADPQPAQPVIVPPPPRPESCQAADHTPADWLTRIQSQATATSRLLAFARLNDQLTEVSATDARLLVELFPAGWMRRRVLQRLFSAGLVGSSEATQILTDLEATPVTYLWLAGALLDSADTSADQRQTLIDRAPSATIKRLLEVRNRA